MMAKSETLIRKREPGDNIAFCVECAWRDVRLGWTAKDAEKAERMHALEDCPFRPNKPVIQ